MLYCENLHVSYFSFNLLKYFVTQLLRCQKHCHFYINAANFEFIVQEIRQAMKIG
jgi:hypothetical protein